MGKLDRPGFGTAQPATVKQADQDAVFEQFGCFQQTPHLLFGKNYRKLLGTFNGGKFDSLVVQTCQPKGKAKPVNGELEIGIGWRIMPLLDEVEIIVNLVDIQLGGQLVKMKGNVG